MVGCTREQSRAARAAGAALARAGRLVPLLALEVDDWLELLKVNLIGPFLAIKHAATHMIEHGGGAILVTGHSHGDSVTVLRESEPGVFVMGDEQSAFPVAITISVPEPGKLVHSWSYGAPGEDPVERDRAELTRSA